jgi:predicted nuclease with TOPRIM domain
MDSTALQYENQKLVQQLEAQKSEMYALERKFKELRDEQCSYDKTLISLNKLWNQVLSFVSDMKISLMDLFHSSMFLIMSMHIIAD